MHYPPWDGKPPENARIEDGKVITTPDHSDSNFLTMLCLFNYEGLEVIGPDGNWIPVAPRPNSFVFNIGDLFSRMMNGRFKATRHRVLDIGIDRYSVPFFLEPEYDSNVGVNYMSKYIKGGPQAKHGKEIAIGMVWRCNDLSVFNTCVFWRLTVPWWVVHDSECTARLLLKQSYESVFLDTKSLCCESQNFHCGGMNNFDNVEGINFDKMFQCCKWLFDKPMEYKRRIMRNIWAPENKNIYRGYFPVVEGEPSRKEGFEFGRDVPVDDQTVNPENWFYERTPWPEEDGKFIGTFCQS
jgi:isopenicillin N synthase-like dioxygenase